MYTLGIETSCDETSAAVVKDGNKLLSNIVISSLPLHNKYGGVIPEIAFRAQMEAITYVADYALNEARVKLNNIRLISVTVGPGLLGSLVVGLSFAKGVVLSSGISLLGVNHLYSHIYASFLNNKAIPEFPFISLVVSGGHTSLFFMEDFDRIKILGSTQDDACGEAFDKTAKILGLGYPGGPIIEKMAKSANPYKIRFNCSNTNKALDFSFSGIKTAVLYYVRDNGRSALNDICASFQKTVIDTLIAKSLLACETKKTKKIVIGGGVAANNYLRREFYRVLQEENGIKCYFPNQELCMDNAAMVAGLGYQLFRKGYRSDLDLNAALN
ncbi:MAG: tRNA (adenosine(37)-N6)-threonylcarbamoyltransferase complex transferase subunit TsaD [Candidatus Omnitrophota bacterium]